MSETKNVWWSASARATTKSRAILEALLGTTLIILSFIVIIINTYVILNNPLRITSRIHILITFMMVYVLMLILMSIGIKILENSVG